MTRLNLSLLLLLMVHFAHAQWKPVPGKISTDWAAKVNPSNPLPEYPRPQLVRKSWINLNGLWQYAILPKGSDKIPVSYAGQILVPYAVESSLSGVGKMVGENNVLWYNRSIDLPAKMMGGKLLLHFGAVDWSCRVYVNGKLAGEHAGGYDAFSFDLTSLVRKGVKQNISVQVWDPTDDGPQPRGKQVKQPKGIWYTPVTGIWQTVWLENVPQTYIVATKQTPDIDKKQLAVRVEVADLQSGDQLEVTAWEGAKRVALQAGDPQRELILNIPDPRLWSPESPFLYDLKVAVKRKGKTIDEVASYFGMRKSAMAKDAAGIQRMTLNNQFVFQYGPLDQGWWPDGLYTAPTDEALKFDIEKTKALGFNMIRKHVKVEPARWYYHCDKMGMLVWQDMPSGDTGGNVWDAKPGFITGGKLDKDRSPESENIFRKEWKAIMDQCYNYPSIVSWVPFNEAWGQFKTKEIVDWTMKYDPSRLVNAASGGNYFMGAGQVLDLHIYPAPAMPDPAIFGARQALVLGEFGGLGLPIEGHTWLDKGNWGYQSYKNKEDLFAQYTKFISAIPKLIRSGLSAAVYTQTTDVEIETNGLFTYDRKVLKMPLDGMYQLHRQLYDPSLVKW
ncbi:glycoside hydrolase family 2 protein [Pedobacter heparinus]|uniref:Glycoside hydrolase family 2 sugar binding n=1 Tax=Pedobacter heparinus (strain ATCC 13125 / DSM 2366 / CIP 104194 / JCM 7457 / NBRC 12017 / NCIMB 9290 / NRRL B-14731 / HIM 762-3) TaxID=485917 RepID=C6XXQ6_PEDHD|nr:sugar-binding domain-containing protein [Pedobacter heparinus]ACU02310.1 glycoside hydrolase family 2 sugar binding [Pedobacter heparinus DSM 2366]